MTSSQAPELLEKLRGRTSDMVEGLATLVGCESPSTNIEATARCAEVTDELGSTLLGSKAERIVVEDRTHLRWRFGSPTRVVLIGHFDTVWPVGTLARWPFSHDDDRATGPGSFDMKAGIIQLFHSLSVLDDLDGVAVLLTSDEEISAKTSRGIIEETVQGARAALVLEPSAMGALKTERKGLNRYQIRVTGRAAHAGLDPEKGINAGIELAHQLLAVAELSRPEVGTTVTPTMASAGTSSNSVPAVASLDIDARVRTTAEAERVDVSLRELVPVVDGTSLEVERITVSPPMPRSASAELYSKAQDVATELELGSIPEASVGGGSDGNLVASLGVPVLDGLGAVGDCAHAEGEHVIVSAMPERAALVAALVSDLLSSS